MFFHMLPSPDCASEKHFLLRFPSRPWRPLRSCVIALFLLLLVFFGSESPLAYGVGLSPVTLQAPQDAASKGKPNLFNPTAAAQSKNTRYKPGPVGTEKPHAPQPIVHSPQVSMTAGSVDLKAGQASHFVGDDGHLDVSIPGNAITAQDLMQAGGKLTLQLSQIAPASGSNAGGSGHLSLGTYLLQLVDARGVLVNHGLRTSVAATYHYGKQEAALNLGHAYVVQNGNRPQHGVKMAPAAANVSVDGTFGAPSTHAAQLNVAQKTLSFTPLIGTPSTSMSWESDVSIGTFGKPDPFNVDLNAGGLTAALPIDLPAGPGGLTPPVSLSYSSEGVNSQHNPTGAVGWVGEGWNLNLGEITWSEHNVYAGCTTTACGGGVNWENTWQLSDPFGTSSEIIPPNINVSTFYDDTSNTYCGTGASGSYPCPVLWHTATESRAKIYSYIGPNSLTGMTAKPPCFRVWLANGIMEEFGCTPDSLQHYYQASVGAHVISGWLLDLITDPQGNQIHLTYQQDVNTFTDPTTHLSHQAIRDEVLSTIEYDSPACHDAQNMCTGSNWNPLVRVNFQAGHGPARVTGTAPTGCNTGANLRCDDPLDLSGSGGVAAPEVQSTFVLNDIQVQIRSSGAAAWNTLRDYQPGYEQSGPTTITDPSSGKQESVAGMLDLTQMQEVGDAGATALMYSGADNNASTSFAYMKVFDLSSQNIVVGPTTSLSYWIYPQSSNGTCVAIDMIFTDGSDLRDSGAVDQYGNQLHPAHQCGHLALNQWNQVISTIGAAVTGKTISRIDVGYDQGANTGGYHGYLDDISLSNPSSTTPLFATSFESGDPQPTWTNTVDVNIANVGGYCCGLTGPEMGTRQEIAHADGAALPLRTFSYTSQTNYYEDDQFKPNPSTNCGPSWNTGNGSGCLLWGQNYANNNRFLSAASNGMGLAQSFSWALARSNTHGVPGGGSNNADPLYCNAHQSGYPCNEADDQSWSHVVLTQGSDTTLRLTQQGQAGAQSSPLAFHGANDGNWAGNVQTLSVSVTLNAGNNTLLLSNASGWAPNVDRITVGGQSYEAEGSGNTLAGGAIVATCSGCSGGAEVGFVGNGGTLQFNTVNVPTAGSYAVTISYIDADAGRSAQLSVDRITTPVTSTTGYTYQLTYPLASQQCSDCVAGLYWGNQNDVDYLSYYNNKFMGFTQATVSLPDGASEVHKYYATEGIGIYDTGEVTCYAPNPCHASPWWHLGNAAHGHEYETLAYDTNGTTLLKHTTNTYQALCPPSGVAATPSSTMNGHTSTWDGNLVSELDHNNPVAVCDVQQTQSVDQTIDGSGNSVSTTTASTYDSYGRVTQATTTANGGTPNVTVSKTAYVWNDAVTATQTSASGTYIIDTPAFKTTEDGSGNRSSCRYTSYDGAGYATGASSSLTAGLATTADSYTNCGTSANSFTPSGQIRTTQVYDQYGNSIATNDADANASIAGHTGCSVNSVSHTDCSFYDSTFATLETSSTNVLNQTASTGYSSTAGGGFGIWPMSTTDFNTQTSRYTYDSLGRMTSQTLPGESPGNATKSWTFSTWCIGTAAQAPCIEIDQLDRLNSSTTVASRAFYDGEGRLVETRDPGPNGQDVVAYAYRDASGHIVFESNSYVVASYNGPAGPAAFAPMDSTQVGTSTTYDGAERPRSVSDPNSQTTQTSYSVQCGGIAGYSADTGCYERTTIIDANTHQRATLTDGFGRVSYDQRYTGNSSGTYALSATTAYSHDTNGNLTTIQHPGNSATTTSTFDAAGRKVSMSDPDRGNETSSYDPNGNLLQTVDARGSAGTVYAGYDGLNRLLWRNTTNSPTGAQVSYTYDSTAAGNNGVGRKTGENFTGPNGLSGSYSYTYDPRGQQSSMTTTVNGTGYTMQKTYDDAGNPQTQTYPTGEIVQTNYSSQGWLNLVTTTQGSVMTTLAGSISYSGAGGASTHITGMTLGNGLYTYTASYDPVQRLTSSAITKTSTGTLLYQTQPTYDAVNDVTGVATTLGTVTDHQQFCYNEQNQMIWAGASGTSPCGSLTPGTLTAAQYQQSFSYDTNGRMTTGPQGSYTYGSSPLHAVTSTSNGYSAAYDAAGNMTCRAPSSATACFGTQTGQQLSYDATGRLTTWQNQPTPTSAVNYLYDGEGTRVALQTTNGVGPATSTTAYIGSVEEVQTAGSTTTTTTYYYAGSERIAEAVNGTFSYLGSDRLGSPVVNLSTSGITTATQLYAPYGASRYSSGTMPTDIGYTGQHADSATGLDYYVSRYYDPGLGQFISPDSELPQSGYTPWGLSRYAYVQGNPETATDPDGHCWPWCTMLAGALIGAAIGAGMSIATQAASGHGINWHTVAKETAIGIVSGAISGLAGPEAGMAVHIAVGAASGAGGQVVSNVLNHKPLGDGVLMAAAVGGITGGAYKGAGKILDRFAGKGLKGFTAKAVDGLRKSFGTKVEDFNGLVGASYKKVISRLPSRAVKGVWGVAPSIPQGGMKWSWTAGGDSFNLRMHGPNLNAPPGSNSSSGWIMRVVRNGNDFLDTSGNWVTGAFHLNSAHIPIRFR